MDKSENPNAKVQALLASTRSLIERTETTIARTYRTVESTRRLVSGNSSTVCTMATSRSFFSRPV